MASDEVIRALAGLDPADLDLTDPPASVWDGIEAAIESGRGGSPGSPPANSAVALIEYAIDASDVLAEVGAGWAAAAIDHAAPDLVQPGSSRVLWDAIEGDEMRAVWQLVVEQVRSTQSELRVPFRCDAAHARRWYEMAIAPAADGGVRFRSSLVFEAPRSPVALLDPTATRDDRATPIALCSWCGRAEHDGAWLAIERLISAVRLLERDSLPPLTPGICSACREQMSAELRGHGVSASAPS